MICNHKPNATVYISLIRGLAASGMIGEAHALSSKKNYPETPKKHGEDNRNWNLKLMKTLTFWNWGFQKSNIIHEIELKVGWSLWPSVIFTVAGES